MPQIEVDGLTINYEVQGIHLAARHPGRVRSLSLHSGWHASDDYLKVVVEQWRTLASTLPSVADVVIQGIFHGASRPRCSPSGRSSWTRWWTSCVAAPPSRWTRYWPRPTRSSLTTPGRHWARSTARR